MHGQQRERGDGNLRDRADRDRAGQRAPRDDTSREQSCTEEVAVRKHKRERRDDARRVGAEERGLGEVREPIGGAGDGDTRDSAAVPAPTATYAAPAKRMVAMRRRNACSTVIRVTHLVVGHVVRRHQPFSASP